MYNVPEAAASAGAGKERKSMKYFVGIDLGTSSVKSLLMREDGWVAGTAQRAYDIVKVRSDWAEQDMELLWNAARETLQELMGKNPELRSRVVGIGYSGQMHGLVALDKAGKPVRSAIIWADQRSADAIEAIYRVIPEERCSSITLNTLSTGFLMSSLEWVRLHEPENYEKIDKVLLPKDYIRYRMCGELGTDASDASGTGAFHTAERRWAWELIDSLGFSRSLFVPCCESSQVSGRITESCARETGLPQGVPVVCGSADTLAQAVGNGMTAPGTLTCNIGTASQMACAINRPLHDPLYRTNTLCHVKRDTWLLMGANLSGGISLKWLKNQIFHMDSYDAMTAEAAAVPAGSEGLFFLPYLNGERTPWNDPAARGIYFGLNLRHTRAHLIRSAMEGIVYGQKYSLEIFRSLGIENRRMIASGGGARGRLFREIQADMFGQEIYKSLSEEQAGIGAAIMAAVGTGAYADYQEACGRIVEFSDDVVEPDEERRKIYEERFQIFQELYPANRELFAKNQIR